MVDYNAIQKFMADKISTHSLQKETDTPVKAVMGHFMAIFLQKT
jgi:hypothetical protein